MAIRSGASAPAALSLSSLDSGNKIGRISPSGTITEFPVPNLLSEIAAGPDGNLWFTEDSGNKIGRITSDK